jgi:hypothetical protein
VVRVPCYRSRGPGFDSRSYQIFWEIVGLERGPFRLLSSTEELLGRNSSDSGLETWEYGRMDPLCSPRNTLFPQKLALTSLTSGGRSRTKATELSFFSFSYLLPARGSLVVKALCYKPECRGFDTRWCGFLNLPNPSGRTRPWGLLSL